MSIFQILVGLLITFFMIIRPFLYKPCIRYFPAELSAAFTSSWLLIGIVLSFPLFGSLLVDNFSSLITSPWLLMSLIKGILLWFMIKLQQIINKTSTSSSVFFGFIAMALGSLINNIFFSEGLRFIQLFCICCLGMLGILFVIQGDARRLSIQGKIYFMMIIIFGAVFSVIDHLTIPQIGWYPHLVFSSLAMFLCCLIYGISKQDYYNILRNKDIILAGSVYMISEFVIIYSSINILPVSIVALFMRSSAPVVMLISAFRYKEQSLINQVVFGTLALVFAVPIIFY